MMYFRRCNLLSLCQHGFRSSHSCVTQLLQAMNDWSLALESGNSRSVDVIYLDLCAFNCVPQRTCDRKLLSKLQLYGVIGNCYIDLIENFLIDRKQRVCVRGSSSDWVNVTSGVPQGSVLGPTLFITFVNDIPNVINSILLMFADDTKLYRTIDSPQDRNILQHNIDQFCVWGDWSVMSFNLDKCHVMSFGKTCEVYNCITTL